MKTKDTRASRRRRIATRAIYLSGIALLLFLALYPTSHSYPVTFEWNEAGGFKNIYCPLKPIPVLGTIYEFMVILQSRRRIASTLRKIGWKSARGTCGMLRLGVLPIVFGISNQDDTIWIDPYETDLMHAAARGDKGLVRQLLSRGADVNASSQRGYTALIFACEGSDSDEIIKMLLAAGANINARDKSGQTALLWAVRTPQRKELVAVLLASGADISQEDKWGETALSLAEDYHAVDVVQMLKAAGANR